MLVLTRKSRESVVVGGADGFHRLLKVTVLDIAGGRVRLGFEVDAGVPVHRSEVLGTHPCQRLVRPPDRGLRCASCVMSFGQLGSQPKGPI